MGSNLSFGDDCPAVVLEAGLEHLKERGLVIRCQSRFFKTPAFPAGSGPDFVNAAAVIETDANAYDLLAHLHHVEAQMGRARGQRWGARTLDLDLIAFGAQVLPDAQTHRYWRELSLETQKTAVPPELILPHPRLEERAFVLVPMLDVAPEWCHPVTGLSVREMHDALPQAALREVIAL